jgi:hypothetical protein
VTFFAVHAPQMQDDVDALLDRIDGGYEVFFDSLATRYGARP